MRYRRDQQMTSSSQKKRLARVVKSCERSFGKKVLRVSTPGGSSRASYKIHFEDQSIIATLRPNFRRTHIEAHVLRRLEPHCDLIPRCLGVDGEVMFQSYLGARRLNLAIQEADDGTRQDMAAEAIRAIFKIQEAARKTDLRERMPHLGNNPAWVSNFVEGATALKAYSPNPSAPVDTAILQEKIAVKATQFVKWDCRSGNAALGDDDVLRWFDFEYCGMRHGAEDIAWLIGDEAWPLVPQTMLDIVRSEFDPNCGHKLDDYLAYLSLYLTFHAAQRFKLIIKEANKRGWQSKARIRRYDDAGVHPEFGAQICRVGAFFASRNKVTAPISRDFEAARTMFLDMILQSLTANAS